MAQHTLDTSRLLCFMLVIRTQDKIKELHTRVTLVVISTDPGTVNDIPAWCRINGHQVDDVQEKEGEVIIQITVCE